MNAADLTDKLKSEARRLGFEQAGVCPAVTPTGIDHFHQWLAAGYAGQMDYLPDRRSAYEHPRHVLEGAESLLMLTMDYHRCSPKEPAQGQGSVSRYAWGNVDYHDLIHDRLKQLVRFLCEQIPGAKARGVVDSAPLMERDFAQMAGLGWIGKNTLLLNKQRGSWFFLAALLTDVPLQYDTPTQSNHCGTCRACLDACPTDAFPQPYVLDATRCISYLTIELREPIPHSLRSSLGNWAFGCDICQQVCPWNNHAPESEEAAFEPAEKMDPLELLSLFEMNDQSFRERFRKTPLWRSRRRGILRNAAIVLGNRPFPEAVTALSRGLNDPESIVRGASAWALSQHDLPPARKALKERLEVENDVEVRREIEMAVQE